ncbi:MAG: hypothetical protein ACAH80_03715 [Alphaproteobacteria bacterium]
MDLTQAELRALLALGRISNGEENIFLNILDADRLVTKKLAERIGKGQYILTDEGHAMIAGLLPKKN